MHPFWYSLHDESTPLIAKYSSSLHIAELIYKEKVFFSTHAPFIQRPRDDKAASLVRMLHEEVELTRMKSEVEAEEGTEQDETGNCKSNGTAGSEIGVEIRSGKNQVVRRMIEALGYQVIKLDRVVYAGLTKKDLPRGYYRHLTEQEVAFLKMSK